MAHIRRFDRDYSRREFLANSAKGMLGAGLLGSAWSIFARTGSTGPAYPDELNSIEEYTRGKLKAGDVITRENADVVKDLLDPVRYKQIMEMGRRLTLAPTTTDMTKLNPPEYIEATLRNRGKAQFDAKGNVVTREGKPWIGGNPFPEPQSAIEVFAAHTLSWGRHDSSFYPTKEYDLDEVGNMHYQYSTGWAEMATIGRIALEPKPYLTGHEDKVRYQSVFFVEPNDMRGVAYLNIWAYDQTQFPELYGYLPAFKRVRRFPTNQRFEALNPGSELYLSDAWAAGDPFMTWGNYKIVGRGPYLAGVSGGWNSSHPNWEHKVHGGPKGSHFWDTTVELVPETIVVEAEPVMYPRAPVGKKRVWFDARTFLPLCMVSYDRRGQMFRHFDGSFSVYDDGKGKVMDGKNPYWSWSTVHAYNVQTNRMTRIEQVREIPGGFSMRVNDPSIYEKYLTIAALQRLGG
ncbi:MAG: DUF1329 domain-containing protein [Sterolibacterium sp.]